MTMIIIRTIGMCAVCILGGWCARGAYDLPKMLEYKGKH